MADQEWVALVTWQVSTDNIDAGDLVQQLPGYAVTEQYGDTFRAQMVLDAPTLRLATDTALKHARKAFQTVAALGDPIELRVLAREAWLRELAKPRPLELVAATGAGELLKVSKQRAHQIAATHEDFPDPIATVSGVQVWTRASVEAFAATDWKRKPGPKAKVT